ncbi:hypothetical protein JKF63_03823 [Porcisia hertigi]|uniref:Uncharacterized protein n=1 Tax=Porcisia hertigi TaxID=2761500 RepID=A0A836HU16_9TRYP|nr:hypothetical protein JKF63_03823 [Porcisia hertigi]
MRSCSELAHFDDLDDFTYTEDPAGEPVKVPISKEYVFKVVVLGDYSVGKTSIIKRLLSISSSSFSLKENGSDTEIEDSDDGSNAEEVLEAVTPTLGTDFYSLTLPQVLPGASVRLQIWDTAGLEKYAAQYSNTFRNMSFLVCVFDVTSARSLQNVVDRHLSIAAKHVPDLDQSRVMVVANKIDMVDDVANKTTALRKTRKRAQSPETVFVSQHGADITTESNHDSLVLLADNEGADQDAVVTADKVQAEVFDLFSDVHYAEVSAKTKQHIRRMLRTVCYALLRNSTRGDSSMPIPDKEPASELLKHTALRLHPGATFSTGTIAPASVSSGPYPDPAKPKAPPAATQQNSVNLDNLDSPSKQNSALPTVSWRSAGILSFDIAPLHSCSSSDFSPRDGFDGATEKRDGSNRGSSNIAANQGSPIENSYTQLPSPRESLIKTTTLPPTAKKPQNAFDRNEDLKKRKEREQEEMRALLARASQRKGNPNGVGDRTGDSALVTRGAVERVRDTSTAKLMTAAAMSVPQPEPTFSVLDSLGVSNDHKGRNTAEARASEEEEDDEDGARLQTQLRDRFAQIEHDMRTNAAAAKLRAEKTKKKSKSKGNCNCCLL